jgi:Protein kinase domain
MSPSPTRLCPKCAVEVRDGWRVCPACATPLQNGQDAETKTVLHDASSVSSAEEGRFPAGTVLAARYRVLGLIGQGGMGEVYRAYDLILNQAVALKFLGRAGMSEAALARFRNEVRIARQVSHPNVCRVYDIGFIDGFHFLSMEYLDGEDLASLIRRIGRLPQDKAIEFARKICAGLAAAHDRGVLHRDLKPANIMIDGRGQVRITDFGLAALAQEVAIGDIRSGTPAYMSPEQKAGREVTTRSDLYSLGLTLHELFTGKHRGESQSSPTEIVRDLDPAIERVILRCLEEDPKRRPSGALNVAMALPGGDPIAAALAAGETPSPEMVAASGEKEGFSPRAAVLCFVGVVLLGAFSVEIAARNAMLTRARIDIPPEALAYRAQDILKQLGYTERPQSTAYGFDCCDAANLRFVERQGTRRDALLASHQPPVIRFWYRQHQGLFLADDQTGFVTYDLPANVEPEMVRLSLDAKGRLFELEARPKAVASAVKASEAERPFDWGPLFAASGLDPTRFMAATPQRTPPMAFDTRAAWTGKYADDEDARPEQVRVDAAAWQGRAVYFNVAGDWHPQSETQDRPRPVLAVGAFLLVGVILSAALMAWRNLRLGRGDRKGAGRIAGFAFFLTAVSGILIMEHVATFRELALLVAGISGAGFTAAVVWLFYLAIEPFARRHWPDALISWNRLLDGRFRDPLVASHILAGFVAFPIGVLVINLVYAAVAAPPVASTSGEMAALTGTTRFVAGLLNAIGSVPVFGMAFLVLAMLLRLLLRRIWIADLFAAALLGLTSGVAVDFSDPYRLAATLAAYLFFSYLFLWLLRRFGLLAVMAMGLMNSLFGAVPFPSLMSWYSGRTLVGNGIIVAMAAWALWVVLSAKRGTESATA